MPANGTSETQWLRIERSDHWSLADLLAVAETAAVDLNQVLASRRAPAGLDTSRREASLPHYRGRVRVAPVAAGSRSIHEIRFGQQFSGILGFSDRISLRLSENTDIREWWFSWNQDDDVDGTGETTDFRAPRGCS